MSEKRAYAGIDIGGTNIKFGLVAPDGQVIHREQRPTMADKGADALMHLIGNIGEQLLLVAAEEEYEVKWLGVGTPGAVNFKTGQVIGLCPNIPGWQGIQIGSNLNERLNLPILVDNDVNCMAIAESTYGAGLGAESVICITFGTGVGGGIILDGKLFRGHNYSAGELGHITINHNGPECGCGSKGCLEVYASSKAIIARAKQLLEPKLTNVFEALLDGDLDRLNIRRLFSAFKKKDAIATQVLEETSELIGAGLAGIVNLFNPQVVVIGGGVADGDAGFIKMISQQVRKRAFSSATEKLSIVKASLGNDAGFIGAGLLGTNEDR